MKVTKKNVQTVVTFHLFIFESVAFVIMYSNCALMLSILSFSLYTKYASKMIYVFSHISLFDLEWNFCVAVASVT